MSQPAELLTSPASRPADAARVARLEFWALAAIVAAAAFLRFREAADTPLWFDEIFTLWVSRLGPAGILGVLAQDLHPPLHFLLEWLWRGLGGEGDLWIKSLSILFGLLTIPVLWGFTRELFGRRAALLAALLLALHPVHLAFSHEARAYGLMWLLVTLATWMAWRWIERGRVRDGLAFVLSATAALYSLYWAVAPLAFLGLWGLVALRRRPRWLAGWIALHLAVAVLFVPQFVTLLHQAHRYQGEHWLRLATPRDLLDWARHLTFGGLWLVAPLFALAALPLFRARERRGARILWFAGFAPVAMVWVVSATRVPLFTERYMDFVVPAWCALLAAGITGLRWAAARWLAAAVVVLLDARAAVLHRPLPEAAQLQRAAEFLRAHARPDDLVFFGDTHGLFFFRHHVPWFRRQRLVLEGPRLPYYAAPELVPPELRVRPEAVRRAQAAGERWWAVSVRHAGREKRTAPALFDSCAVGRPLATPMVTVWAGQETPPASAAVK
ncbi:MAG: glycosyltransferase family 39 protein [Candidatus Eisenbacteria bacterium]|nr:glycosyltransferase family 39 protein [Candidatus Eisenbacteria bacterium]